MAKSLISAFISLLALPLTAMSQTSAPVAADFFNSAPIDVATGLSQISRLDMVDYFNSGSTVKSENRLGRKSALKSLSDEMIVWQDDDSVTTAIVVLPGVTASKSDTLLMVIRTIAEPMPDSELSFYDSGWHRVDDKRFPHPSLSDWVKPEGRKAMGEIGDALPFMLATVNYDPQTKTLVFTNRMSSFFVAGDAPGQLDLLRPELRYSWNGKSFIRPKE